MKQIITQLIYVSKYEEPALNTGFLNTCPNITPYFCPSSNSGYSSTITFSVKPSLTMLHKNDTLSTPISSNTFPDILTFR